MNRVSICAIASAFAVAPIPPVKADELPVKAGVDVPFCVHRYDMDPYLNTILVLHDYQEAAKTFHGKCGVIDGGLVDAVLGDSDDTKFGRMKHVTIHTETSRSHTLDVYIVVNPAP